MVKQLLEELQNNFSDHSVAISNKMSIVFNKKSDHRILDQIFKFLEP